MIRDAGPTLTGQAVRARGSVAPQFLAHHALSAPDAIAFVPANERERRAFAALVRDGAVRGVRGDRFYLDLPRYRLIEEARTRRLVPLVIAVAIAGAVVAMLFY